MPRKYVKKSDYWNQFDSANGATQDGSSKPISSEEVKPASAGDAYYTEASCSRNVGQLDGESATRTRRNYTTTTKKTNKYLRENYFKEDMVK